MRTDTCALIWFYMCKSFPWEGSLDVVCLICSACRLLSSIDFCDCGRLHHICWRTLWILWVTPCKDPNYSSISSARQTHVDVISNALCGSKPWLKSNIKNMILLASRLRNEHQDHRFVGTLLHHTSFQFGDKFSTSWSRDSTMGLAYKPRQQKKRRLPVRDIHGCFQK